MDSTCLSRSSRCSICWINISRIAAIWTWSILSYIRIIFNLLSNKIISLFTNACIKSLYVMRMWRACWAFSVYSDVSFLTETAAFIKIFIKITLWRNKWQAWSCCSIINFSVFTSWTLSFYYIISKSTNACLFWWWIFLIFATWYFNASIIDEWETLTASACIIFWKICLIDWATLANILNYY